MSNLYAFLFQFATNMDNPRPDLSLILQDSFRYGSSTQIPNRTSNVYLLGYPITHSLAPILHNTAFSAQKLPWIYHILESAEEQKLVDQLSQDTCIGAAVTMPHKVTFIPFVDEITDEGTAIGAINTVFIRLNDSGRRYIGTNTDSIGVREAFLQNIATKEDLEYGKTKPALVIGGGGACRSAIYALHRWLGVSEIYIVNRVRSEVDDIIASFAKLPSFHTSLRFVEDLSSAKELPTPFFVVGTVPDCAPQTQGEITASLCTRELLGRNGKKGVVLEMCYHPKIRTSFLNFAEYAGWTVIPGTEALLWQGIVQQILWTESEEVASSAAIEEARRVVHGEIAKRAES